MKKIQNQVFAFILLIMITVSAFAQTSGKPEISAALSQGARSINTNTFTSLTEVNPRSMRDFNNRFGIGEANWMRHNDTTMARFYSDSVTTVAGYAKNGRWIYTLRTVHNLAMPADLRHTIRSQYYDFDISAVHEIEYATNPATVYIIRLSDRDKNYKIIRVTEDEIRIVKTGKQSHGSAQVLASLR